MEELVTEVKKANHQQQARHQEQKAMLKETLMEQCQQNSLLHVEMALACRTRLWVSSTTLNRFILKITESDDVEAFFFAPHKGKVGRGNTLANLIAAFLIGHAQQPRKERKFKLLYRKTQRQQISDPESTILTNVFISQEHDWSYNLKRTKVEFTLHTDLSLSAC